MRTDPLAGHNCPVPDTVTVMDVGEWTRVQRMTWTLTARALGWDLMDELEQRSRQGLRGHDPDRERERLTTWRPAARLLALALWRASQAEQIPVGDVPLHHAGWWLGGRDHPGLWADPLPEWDPVSTPGSWESLRAREHELIPTARWIATWHSLHHYQDDPLADVEDPHDLDPPMVRLADRVRAVQAGPVKDGADQRWQFGIDLAHQAITRVSGLHAARVWTPSPAIEHACRVLLPSLNAVPGHPAIPQYDGPMPTWLQRILHLAAVEEVIQVVKDHHRQDASLGGGDPTVPFGDALARCSVELIPVLEQAADLEHAWARDTPASVAAWERERISRPLREHIRALEKLLDALCRVCSDIAADPDEPH